jgi:hypothetical protein
MEYTAGPHTLFKCRKASGFESRRTFKIGRMANMCNDCESKKEDYYCDRCGKLLCDDCICYDDDDLICFDCFDIAQQKAEGEKNVAGQS